VYLKIYKVDNEVMVAVCDEKYLGRELSDGKAQLKITEKFYGRTPASCEEVATALQEATIANLVGEESVACAIGAGIIEEGHVIYISNVPHAQMVSL
jgi:hypothetical protein